MTSPPPGQLPSGVVLRTRLPPAFTWTRLAATCRSDFSYDSYDVGSDLGACLFHP